MRELSLHILDIVENGITAGADCIHIEVNESRTDDRLTESERLVTNPSNPFFP